MVQPHRNRPYTRATGRNVSLRQENRSYELQRYSTGTVSVAVYLQLTMQLLEQEEPVQIDLAAVRWSSATRFGVEFIKIRPEEGERLKKFVKMLESTT